MEKAELTVIVCSEDGYIPMNNVIPSWFYKEISHEYYGFTGNLSDMLQQMAYVAQYFGKEEHPDMIHLVVDYGFLVKDDETASTYSWSCVEYFCRKHQIYCYTYQDMQSLRYYSYMLINPVSYIDGTIFNANINNMNTFCEHISKTLGIPSRLFFQNEQ